MRKPAPVHGGLHHHELSEFSLDAAEILDFSVNINPYGPTERVLQAAHNTDIRHYGDPTGAATRDALAEKLAIDSTTIALGNGAAELMWSLARVLATDGRPSLVVTPTFSEYSSALHSHGTMVESLATCETRNFVVDLGVLEERIRGCNPASVYICTPNNPTGAATPIRSLKRTAKRFPNTLFIVDQAFLSLSPDHEELRESGTANMVLLRSLTKDHAIPGLRVGYLVAPAPVVCRLEATRPPWTVSTPAQAALLASFDEEPFLAKSRARITADKDYLETSLLSIGLSPLPSQAPFLITRIGDAGMLRERLLRSHNVLIRDCHSFGLPNFMRLAARPKADVDTLLRALRKELP